MKVCSRTRCKHKGKHQKTDQFYANVQLKDGLSSHCKTCVKEARDRTQANKLANDWWKIIIG